MSWIPSKCYADNLEKVEDWSGDNYSKGGATASTPWYINLDISQPYYKISYIIQKIPKEAISFALIVFRFDYTKYLP